MDNLLLSDICPNNDSPSIEEISKAKNKLRKKKREEYTYENCEQFIKDFENNLLEF